MTAFIHDDAAATALMGPKCPECGWREGKHRPRVPSYQNVWEDDPSGFRVIPEVPGCTRAATDAPGL